MKTKRLATELLIPIALFTLVAVPILTVANRLGVSGELQTTMFIALGVIFICLEESLMSRLSRRFGLPPPRRIGKRRT
jgi:membrane protein implicated in regulation of membrane protease activity